jgi:hypothetical protein
MDGRAGVPESSARAYLVDLLEGVGAARGPTIDGLAGDGGEPGGLAGGDLLPARSVREAPAGERGAHILHAGIPPTAVPREGQVLPDW